MPVRLILNADDFGLTTGVNRAIEELHRAGAITSATLMATGGAFEDAVEVARRNPSLGVGCHVVLVDGIPVSHPDDIPSLLGGDGKTFRPSLIDFIQTLLRGGIDPDEIALEVQAQIQKVQRAGIDVTHVDTHKHTHIFPCVAEPLLHTVQRCGVGAVRNPFEPPAARARSRTALRFRSLQIWAASRLEPHFRGIAELRNAEVLTSDGTLGISATGSLDEATLRGLLDALASPAQADCLYELCCHPGYHDSSLDRIPTRLRAARDRERLALLKVIPALGGSCNGPDLMHYGNLGVPGLQRASGQYRPNTGYEKVY